jgi:SAM-dependent methyltransferase
VTDEASKTRAIRGADFAERYLRGRVIDIGCGEDLVVPHAEPFDLKDGDAQEIGGLREHGAYDAVCSFHCLEHMRDVPRALEQWWALVKDGGYLVLVVPDEDLYEQGGWPSLFNADHKATFGLRKQNSWSPVSYDVEMLVKSLQGAVIVSCERHDAGYDHGLRRTSLSRADRVLYKLRWWCGVVCRRLGPLGRSPNRAAERIFSILNTPVDQTQGAALAQIQIIAKKTQAGTAQ